MFKRIFIILIAAFIFVQYVGTSHGASSDSSSDNYLDQYNSFELEHKIVGSQVNIYLSKFGIQELSFNPITAHGKYNQFLHYEAKNRKISPLKKTKDMVLLNSSSESISSCFMKIKKIIDRKLNN